MGLIVTLIFSILKLFLAFVGLIANIIIKILPYIFKFWCCGILTDIQTQSAGLVDEACFGAVAF